MPNTLRLVNYFFVCFMANIYKKQPYLTVMND